MIELKGDLWSFWKDGHPVAVTTNGIVKSNGCAVMGAGVALEAKSKLPRIDTILGKMLTDGGNHVFYLGSSIFSFPTKYHFWEKSDICLIIQSCKELLLILDHRSNILGGSSWKMPLILPRPGCGMGGLKWEVVKPIIKQHLDERVAVISK